MLIPNRPSNEFPISFSFPALPPISANLLKIWITDIKSSCSDRELLSKIWKRSNTHNITSLWWHNYCSCTVRPSDRSWFTITIPLNVLWSCIEVEITYQAFLPSFSLLSQLQEVQVVGCSPYPVYFQGLAQSPSLNLQPPTSQTKLMNEPFKKQDKIQHWCSTAMSNHK